MGQEDESLKAAIDDIGVVAAELRELRLKIQQYGEATKRLDKVSDSLIKLTESVTSVQRGMESIIQRAGQVQTDMEASRGTFEAMTASIPGVVAKIEATDAAKNVAEFTQLLAEVRDLIYSQQGAAQGIQSVVDAFSGLSIDLKSIKESTSQQAQLLQLVNQVLMQNVAGPVNENARLLGELKTDIQDVGVGANKATEGMATLSVKLIKEIESLRNDLFVLRGDVSSSAQLIKDQGARIEVLSKKKGLLF